MAAPWQLGLLRTRHIGGERGEGGLLRCGMRGFQVGAAPQTSCAPGLPAGASASWGTRWAWLGGLEAETLLGA